MPFSEIYSCKGAKERWTMDWMGTIRDAILGNLLRLKEEKYGDFIGMPIVVLKLTKSDRCKEVTRNCIFKEVASCPAPHGRIKKPCMMWARKLTACVVVVCFHFICGR
ncbi:MAG TPA: hypothetical protein ACFYEJ_08565 [Candidatus Wujingus californicus]|nr:hypothetical protein [Planctomycetota bacterium]MDO8131478.1 hypothetical protein [Candidatus Brocadiales bacterium]